MNIQIEYKPAATLAVVQLAAGETIRAESGAMVSMSSNIDVRTDGPMNKRQGGFLKGLKRSVLGGETFFTNTFTAVRAAAEVTLAPSLSLGLFVHERALPSVCLNLRADQAPLDPDSHAGSVVAVDPRAQSQRHIGGPDRWMRQALYMRTSRPLRIA